MDELEFVAALKKKFPFSHGLGIGDDASVVRSGKRFQLVSSDMLIEDVHFRLSDVSQQQLAQKALAANISDIAAMGGRAQYFYLNLGFPGRLSAADLRLFFTGLKRGCRKWNVELAGGDYSRSEKMFIAIAIVGQSQKPILRRGARPGDWIAVTGPVGESALGLQMLLQGETTSPFIRKHKQVIPQCQKGLVLAGFVNAMIDISDGLLLDLSRMLKASGTGAEIDYEKIPVSPTFKKVCRQYHLSEKDLVLAGGEDYQLLFAVSPRKEILLQKTKIAYRIIGRMTAQQSLRVRENGRPIRIPRLGFDHFHENKAERT
ncbi:MAG: thiamine-phosphate kinase [Candidatus Aminicenantes bacterium]|nr:thiamine-phosphate kinase [Candidatus Aminicenantes bacterium]